MRAGTILVADHQGAFAIKLIGDVRVTLCASFDEFVEQMLQASDFSSVIINLEEAEGIDSTTLGLLAKVSILARERYSYTPVIVSTNDSITRLLTSMGFDAVFDLHTSALETDTELAALDTCNCSEDGVREKVIEAHKILMGLNEENKARFEALVTTLERDRAEP